MWLENCKSCWKGDAPCNLLQVTARHCEKRPEFYSYRIQNKKVTRQPLLHFEILQKLVSQWLGETSPLRKLYSVTRPLQLCPLSLICSTDACCLDWSHYNVIDNGNHLRKVSMLSPVSFFFSFFFLKCISLIIKILTANKQNRFSLNSNCFCCHKSEKFPLLRMKYSSTLFQNKATWKFASKTWDFQYKQP